MNSIDYKFFMEARKVAENSDYCKVHVGCVAVYKGKIIGVGFNSNKTHPTQMYYNHYREETEHNMLPKLHAEINCINHIKHMKINFSKVKLYIFRIRNDRPFGICRPCSSCMNAIKDIGIKNIFYTTNDRFVHERL